MLCLRMLFFTVSILLGICHSLFSQNAPTVKTNTLTRRGTFIGLHLILADFNKPYLNKLNAGYQLSYFSSISSVSNYMIQGGSVNSDKLPEVTPNTGNQLIHYLQASYLISLPDRQRPIDPFISLGTGLNYASNTYLTPYLLPGAGIHIRLFKNTLLHLQANYQLCLNKHINNSIQLNAGILGAIFRSKKRMVQHPEPPGTFVSVPSTLIEKDTDLDGTPDSQDSCVTIPGPKAFHGCPDSDGDGIPDYVDACPNLAGYAAYQGCQVPDRDHDGIPDDKDKCPDVAGTEQNNGCPDLNDQLEKKVNDIATRIQFAVNRFELTDSTKRLLLEVIQLLKENPTFHLTVEGHTDNSGSAQSNQSLSEQRALSVADYIISNGIYTERVISIGYGNTRPKFNNATAEGRATNRRTELKIASRH